LRRSYKLRWNEPVEDLLPMDDRPGQETIYRFHADRAHVGHGEPLTSWIEVWHQGARDERLPVTIRAASVHAVSGAEQGKILDLVYRDDGQGGDAVAGDRIYTNRFVPSEHEELRVARLVHIQADVEAAGATRVMVRDFTYTPRPVLESDAVSDAIVEGHLAIHRRLPTQPARSRGVGLRGEAPAHRGLPGAARRGAASAGALIR
jgi:hypothetical protein